MLSADHETKQVKVLGNESYQNLLLVLLNT